MDPLSQPPGPCVKDADSSELPSSLKRSTGAWESASVTSTPATADYWLTLSSPLLGSLETELGEKKYNSWVQGHTAGH